MDIGWAVRALKAGDRVRRAGWNGKGMWLVLIPGGTRPRGTIDALGIIPGFGHFVDDARAREADLVVLPVVAMRTAQGELLHGWLASQTDLLGMDWELVEDAPLPLTK